MSRPITIVVRLRAKPRRETAMGEALVEICRASRKEKGCLQYELHQSAEDPALFLLYEDWATQSDLDAHMQTSYVKGFLIGARQYLLDRPEITRWTRLEVSAERVAS